MKSDELRSMSIDELKRNLLDVLKELFNLRMQKGLGSTLKPHHFKKARRDIARIKTILSEKERQQ